ncbi:molybdenum cofactor guanylyltransferase [Phenylobacterium sp.]|uniref:molybdenum cofactor guanylyltransferase n=1 Tax=Phenylobacterium sp. TaxID=1871053 RepID=UPI0035B48A10
MVLGLVLAGGRSPLFGGEKAAARLGGLPLLAHAHRRLAAYCRIIGVNAPRISEAGRLAIGLGAPLVRDPPNAPHIPLAGIAAGLVWAQREDEDLLVALPCETPFVPADITPRLIAACEDSQAAVASTKDGIQPLCSAWRVSMLDAVFAALSREPAPPIGEVLKEAGAAEVFFDDASAFMVIETHEDLEAAEARLAGAES